MCVIFVDQGGNPAGPSASDLPEKPALMWVVPADEPLPDLGPNMPNLSAAWRDAGIIDAPAIHEPDFAGGEFTIRCLETTRTTLDLHTNGGTVHLIIDTVDGIDRVRCLLTDVTIRRGADHAPTPGEPMVWELVATVAEGNVTSASTRLNLY